MAKRSRLQTPEPDASPQPGASSQLEAPLELEGPPEPEAPSSPRRETETASDANLTSGKAMENMRMFVSTSP
jgi:hypothetical protein